MADLPAVVPKGSVMSKNYQVAENKDVQVKRLMRRKQELVSRINRTKQDIEDIKEGQIPNLEANIIMMEQELQMISNDIQALQKGETIEI